MDKFRMQFKGAESSDVEVFTSESPVVSGQALSGAEIFRRQSAGLPIGCAVRSFNEVNPYLDKFHVYDALSSYQIRHGILTAEQANQVLETTEVEKPTEVNNS